MLGMGHIIILLGIGQIWVPTHFYLYAQHNSMLMLHGSKHATNNNAISKK